MGWQDQPLVSDARPASPGPVVPLATSGPNVSKPSWQDAPLVGAQVPVAAPAPYEAMFWPFSMDDKGDMQLDSDAGIIGMIKRIVKAPRDYMEGKIDINTKEGVGRVLETALGMTPIGAASRAAPTALVKRAVKTPSQEELKDVVGAGYQKAADMGVEFNPRAVQKFAYDLRDTLNAKSMLPKGNEEVYSLLDHLIKQPSNVVAIRLQELNEYRKQLGNLAADPANPAKANTAGEALRAFDNFLQTIDLAHIVVRSPSAGKGTQVALQGQVYPSNHPAAKEALDTLNTARGNAAANFRSQRVTDTETTIRRRSSAANSGRNRDNTTRQRLASLLENDKKMLGMNAAEEQFMEDLVAGGLIKNAARHIGNRLGGGGGLGQTFLMGLAGTAGAQTGSPTLTLLAAGAPLIVGNAARATANQLSKKQLKMLDDMIRRRSPEFATREANAPMIKQGPLRHPGSARSLAQGLTQGAAPRQTPEVPLAAGGSEADLLQRRLLDSLKRSGQPWT